MNKFYPLLLEHHLPILVRYCVAAAIMLVCSVVQAGLQMLTGYPSFFLLLPGVFLSGLVFDRGSGLVAAVMAVVAGAYLSYQAGVSVDYLSVNGLFIITAAGTAVVAEFLRLEMKRVMQADKNKALLLQEMAHRTKNNLAVLSAMIRLQAKSAEPDVVVALHDTARRIQITAEVYDHLSLRQDSSSVDMRYFLQDVVEKIFQSLPPSGPVAFNVVSESAIVPHNQALAIGIVVNELVTNSLKYAFPDNRPGQISVRLSVDSGIEVTVADNGVGREGESDRGGLGSRIVLLLTQQLGGTLVYEELHPGLCARLNAPIDLA
ncbi:sensor histidine kinase [Bradyrhizobium acaciae]|uniref:sensor histidine kinase n=1 Tax=Bradyrhizobium acaciae TaxID=2683706 RepID=UPI001E54E8B2|nr:sensor histidine kinase [Bradyrhizobium acaciae]MCC8977318.1 sensor histidine kinase [Bradyrhizobium acaciae]